MTPGTVPIALNFWKEAPFKMTDKELLEVESDRVPEAIRAAVAALAADVNAYIFSKYTAVYNAIGTPGTTPFGGSTPSPADATNVRKFLNIFKAPVFDRRLVLDPEAGEAALNLGQFQDASKSADPNVITDANIGRKLGFDWYEDQQVPTHTAGTITSALAAKSATAQPVDTTNVICTSDNDIDLLEGDIILFAGDPQTYVLTADAARTGAGDITLPIQPGLLVALAGDEAVTLKASHTVNLGFQRNAFAFASRPLADVGPYTDRIETVADPVSGISMRLEITRQYKQWDWSFDILCGAACIDPRKAVRLFG